MKITVYETFPENPSNPACTNMLTGEIEINKSAFDILPEHTKEFVLYHEIGHFKLQTSNEAKADDYALKNMALKKEYSLRNHIDSVYRLARDDERRKRHALISVLTVMANLGNKEAIQLLKTNKNG